MKTEAPVIQISFEPCRINMRTSFKHASAERKVTDSILTVARRGDSSLGIGEGCPRPYVTGETTEAALEWLKTKTAEVAERVTNLTALRDFVSSHRGEIDKCPAAWCSVELALLDLFAREASLSVEGLLGLREAEGPFQYTAVVGDGSIEKFSKTVQQYASYGFWDYKFKISGDLTSDRAKLMMFFEMLPAELRERSRLRLDANNLFTDIDTAAQYLEGLGLKLFALEEPLASRDPNELSALSTRFNLPIILDECLCRLEDVERFSTLPGRWIANIRVSKVGGLLRALEIAERAKELGWPIIVGAQVGETSILTRAALPVADAARPQLVAQEGAFGLLLLERDAVEPVLMFGAGGKLKLPKTDAPSKVNGWGLSLAMT